MAEAREGISGEAAAESSPVIGELQRGGVCQHRRAGQCVLPGEREGDRGEGCGREPGGCEAEDECVIERGAGVMAWDDDLSKGAKTRIAKAGYKSKEDILSAYLDETLLQNKNLGKKTYYELQWCLRYEIWLHIVAPAILRINKEISDFDKIVKSSSFLLKNICTREDWMLERMWAFKEENR